MPTDYAGYQLVELSSYLVSLFYFFRATDDLKDTATPRAIQLTSHVGRPPNGEVVAKEGSEEGAEGRAEGGVRTGAREATH